MKQEPLKLEEYFKSSDLALSATISIWYPLDAIDNTENPHKAVFLFKRDQQLDQLVQSYWKGELRVNPLEFYQALRTIKARLYETR